MHLTHISTFLNQSLWMMRWLAQPRSLLHYSWTIAEISYVISSCQALLKKLQRLSIAVGQISRLSSNEPSIKLNKNVSGTYHRQTGWTSPCCLNKHAISMPRPCSRLSLIHPLHFTYLIPVYPSGPCSGPSLSWRSSCTLAYEDSVLLLIHDTRCPTPVH